jgi:hypothetical protein
MQIRVCIEALLSLLRCYITNMNVVTEIIIFWLEKLLIPVLGIRPTLLVMDLLRSHKTSPVRDVLRAHDITLSLVPGGCTGLVQPVDVSVNRPFKDLLKEEIDLEFERRDIEGAESIQGTSAVGEMRVMMTHCVARAWEKFCNERQEVIVRSFRCLGISLPIDGSADAEISIKGLDTPRLMTALEKWETQGAPANSGSGSSDDADESESGASDINSGPDDDPFASLTDPSVNPALSHTTLKGSLTTSLIIGGLSVAALAMEESCTASRTAGDPHPASRIIGDSASVSVASARIDSAGMVKAVPSVSAPNPTVKKGRESGKAKKRRGRGNAATTSSVSAAAGTGTRRSARLIAKPAQTYALEFPQITDAEETDEDDGVEYGFRWQNGDL